MGLRPERGARCGGKGVLRTGRTGSWKPPGIDTGEPPWPCFGVFSVNRFIALVLALLWLPALGHCELVSATGPDETPGCCSHTDDASEEPAGTCLGDHCEVFENGHYRSGDDASFELVPAPAVTTDHETMRALERDAGEGLDVAVPPAGARACRSWVFAHRAASWANAPS